MWTLHNTNVHFKLSVELPRVASKPFKSVASKPKQMANFSISISPMQNAIQTSFIATQKFWDRTIHKNEQSHFKSKIIVLGLYVNIRFFVSLFIPTHTKLPYQASTKNRLILNTIIYPKWLTFMALNFIWPFLPMPRNGTHNRCQISVLQASVDCTFAPCSNGKRAGAHTKKRELSSDQLVESLYYELQFMSNRLEWKQLLHLSF